MLLHGCGFGFDRSGSNSLERAKLGRSWHSLIVQQPREHR
jgi:hypothetical protein